jgi:DNA-binding response OmpR family regulator
MNRVARLLVIDDVPQNARALEAMLSPSGYSVALAFSGREGLERIRTEQPDAVLLDILMPDMSGYEVCRRIREDPATRLLPVVMLTSSSDQDKVDTIEAGADDFITRPLNPRELLSRVQSLLRIKEIHDRIEANAAQVAEWNRTLELHVRGQLAQLEELERLRRFFLPSSSLSQIGARIGDKLGSRGEHGQFQREGEYWTIAYEGRVTRLRDSKGMRVLAHLLAQPGRPHAALDLERLGALADDGVARAAASSDAGELLDVAARRAYRARLAELGDAIEEAQRSGKADDSGRLREEMDFITRELSRALGLGGRSRRAGSIAERARLNVMRAVRSAVQRIYEADGELGAHFRAAVHTGTVCVYAPDARAPIAWEVTIGAVQRG